MELPENGSSSLIIELELCNNNFILFRKLYSNVEYQFSSPCVPLISQNSKEEIKNKEIVLNGLHLLRKNRNGNSTSFYEFDLGDKKCNE